MRALELALPSEAATIALAQRVAAALADDGLVVYLEGELGAGKSSFARALLRALGVSGPIKSPTYSLVESYPLAAGRSAWHLDLYRIADPGELEWLGLEGLAEPSALVLVEWPAQGRGALPTPDLAIKLAHAGLGRTALMDPLSLRGEALLVQLAVAGKAIANDP